MAALFSKVKSPAAPQLPVPPPPPPQLPDPAIQEAAQRMRKQAAAAGITGTNFTGGQGLAPATTSLKAALGA